MPTPQEKCKCPCHDFSGTTHCNGCEHPSPSTEGSWEERFEKLRCPQCSIFFCNCVELKSFISQEILKARAEGHATGLRKGFDLTRREAVNDLRKLIDSWPMDYCNDGEYTDREILEVASNLLKKQTADIEKFYQSLTSGGEK